jgi:hypothetical protein
MCLTCSFICGAGGLGLSVLLPVSDSKKIRLLRVCVGTCGGTLKAKAYGYAMY